MRVILLQDVPTLGKKSDIQDVKEGYAKNFLFPRFLAKPATYRAMKDLELQRQFAVKKAEEELSKIQGLAAQLDGFEVTVPMKVGEQGQLYEQVTPQKIAERLKELGYSIKKNALILKESIKEVGEYPVLIEFDHGIETKITVIVTEAAQS